MVTGTSARTHRAPLVVSGWATVSPYGLGTSPFMAGLVSQRSAVRELPARLREGGPYATGGWIPDFDIQAVLGRKGTRAMDRLTALAVSTVGLLLESAGPGLAADFPEAVGLVLGTGHGSVKSIMEFVRESLTAAKPYHVDPAAFPNTVMNRAAGQSAIRHTLRGPNATLSGGSLTGLLTLNYAKRLLEQGRAEAVLTGAAEEYSAQRSWLEHQSRSHDARRTTGPLGEGSVFLLLEPEARARAYGRRALAEVLSCRFTAFSAPEGAAQALSRAVSVALDEAEAGPDHIRLMVTSVCGGPLGELEASTVASVLGGHRPRLVGLRHLIGDTSAASAAFQLATALVLGDPGGLALITSVDAGGNVGCALLRLAGASSSQDDQATHLGIGSR